jgi:hypothetical protein
MTRRVSGGNTDLTGEIRDQSQLFGLLDTVRRLGQDLISVTPDGPEGAQLSGVPPTHPPDPKAIRIAQGMPAEREATE